MRISDWSSECALPICPPDFRRSFRALEEIDEFAIRRPLRSDRVGQSGFSENSAHPRNDLKDQIPPFIQDLRCGTRTDIHNKQLQPICVGYRISLTNLKGDLPPIRRQRDEVVSWVREGRTNVSKGRKINGFEWPILCAASYLRGVADSRVERRRCRPRRQAQKYRRQRRSN